MRCVFASLTQLTLSGLNLPSVLRAISVVLSVSISCYHAWTPVIPRCTRRMIWIIGV